MHLRPVAEISPQALTAAKRLLVADAAWASLTGALSGGVVLLAFALALGAGPLTVGLLAAVPFLAQIFQLPAIALVERVRQRKRIGVIGLTVARVLIMLLALLPFLPLDGGGRLTLLIAAHLLISGLGAFASCAINSWFHQLLPADALGVFFARRLLFATALACVGTLAAGLLVDHVPLADPLQAYAIPLAVAGLAGLASSWCLARSPEPLMHDAGPPASLLERLRVPLLDANFRRLLVLLGSWNFASNLAAPFLTVYLLRQLGYSLSVVTTLFVTSQLANAMTLLLWGRVSDRLSNKAVLAVALPVYFACMAGLTFTRVGDPYGLQVALLYVLHVVMGAAGGGIALATGNLGLKLAPQGQGTAYLAAIGLVCAVAGGMAPLAGGAIAQLFELSQLSVVVRWVSPMQDNEVSLLRFSHMEFLFALSALLGLYVLHALSRVREGDEVSERRVVQELALEALRTVNQLSSLGGLLGSLVWFERLTERRMFRRVRQRTADP